MKWEQIGIEEKIEVLEIAQQLVVMAIFKKPAEVKSAVMKAHYQAEEIMNNKTWTFDTPKRLEYETIAYLLCLGMAFKGDVYGYFMNYVDRAYDYLHKTPSDARTRTESDDLDSHGKDIEKEKSPSEGEFGGNNEISEF